MGTASSSGRRRIAVRLDPELHARLQQIAKTEHLSVAAFLEQLVEREVQLRSEAERVIRVHVAPELVGQPQGEILRREGESDATYVRRSRTLKKLFGER